MKHHSICKIIGVGVAALTLAACSSMRHHKSSSVDGSAMNGGNGTYAEGLGGDSGFRSMANCNVPETAGFKTDPYYFAFDSSDIHSSDMEKLQSIANNLATHHSNIKLIGNTDNRGSREYNIALGYRRAEAIAAALKQSGISANQVASNSNGAEKPIAFGNSEEDFQCNRRVDLVYPSGD